VAKQSSAQEKMIQWSRLRKHLPIPGARLRTQEAADMAQMQLPRP
jgi:hypothetical protein